MKIAVIGAGASGLVAGKHSCENGFECEIFEMRSQLGGTWVYTDAVDVDELGFPVYSATYKSLRANVPKEVMGFPDFPIPDDCLTYPTHTQMLRFLQLYTEHFNLTRLIKFNTLVTDIRPIENTSKWKLTYVDKLSKDVHFKEFDVVILCSGNYNKGNLPNIPGMGIFKGNQFHSRHYRTPEQFNDQTILVVGAGPSGADLALEVSTEASTVLMSNHSDVLTAQYPSNVKRFPDVKCFRESQVEFIDGTVRDVDTVFYCTGFNYSFPYLHESCDIIIEENYITPLYKHMIHIERPTMCLIGIPVQVCAFPMFDLQCRFYMKYLNGSMQLPNIEEMRRDTQDEMSKRWSSGYRKREAHKMGEFQQEYYDDLASLSGVKSLPAVVAKVRDNSFKRFYQELSSFRSDRYKIIDEETFLHFC